MNAVDLRDLIKDVLPNPELYAREGDYNMHERLMRAVEEDELDIFDMLQVQCRTDKEGGGCAARVAGKRAAGGLQHFVLKEYKNPKG